MSELRAPDPTLTAHAVEDGDVILTYRGDKPPLAHVVGQFGEAPACGSEDADDWVGSEFARWFAVPCRTCFPDAPIPGVRRDERGRESGDPYLAWAVPS